MNLELLDPFGRQVPDRVDATIQLPDVLHRSSQFREQSEQQQQQQQQQQQKSGTTSSANGKSTTHPTPKSGGHEASALPTNTTTDTDRMEIDRDTIDDDDDINNSEGKAAYYVAFNRRGTYLAVGHASGTVAVHCTLTRTLAAVYYPSTTSTTTSSTTPSDKNNNTDTVVTREEKDSVEPGALSSATSGTTTTGCSSVSWARRSRALLAGHTGDATVRLYDATHPAGPDEAAAGLALISGTAAVGDDEGEGEGMAPSNSNPGGLDSSAAAGGASVAAERAEAAPRASARSVGAAAKAAAAANAAPDEVPPNHSMAQTKSTPFVDADPRVVFLRTARPIPTILAPLGTKVMTSTKRRKDKPKDASNMSPEIPSKKKRQKAAAAAAAVTTAPQKMVACVTFAFPHPVAGSLQINPCRPNSGLAVLTNGMLVLFWVPRQSFAIFDGGEDSSNNKNNESHVRPPFSLLIPLGVATPSTAAEPDALGNNSTSEAGPGNNKTSHNNNNIVCAAFDPRGDKIYAVSKTGILLGYDVALIWKALSDSALTNIPKRLPLCDPQFQWSIAGNSSGSSSSGDTVGIPTTSSNVTSSFAVWHLLVSRNGKFLILNSSDGAIRLYNTSELWDNKPSDKKAVFVFQDVVNKVKFASCDLSGDGEYVVGGANGADNKYELYIWNTSTGVLMDKLTGAFTRMYSVAWHPTRSFLAVACADGVVDVWGPRINWTAFAPDFQALPMNVEYIEREDEFDVTTDGQVNDDGEEDETKFHRQPTDSVDITTIEAVPVFASDSEDERDVFVFETRVKNLLAGRAERASRKAMSGLDD